MKSIIIARLFMEDYNHNSICKVNYTEIHDERILFSVNNHTIINGCCRTLRISEAYNSLQFWIFGKIIVKILNWKFTKTIDWEVHNQILNTLWCMQISCNTITVIHTVYTVHGSKLRKSKTEWIVTLEKFEKFKESFDNHWSIIIIIIERLLSNMNISIILHIVS